MKCPKCGEKKSYVLDSRSRRDFQVKWRRHACDNCGELWSTVEIPTEGCSVRCVVLCENCAYHESCFTEKSLIAGGAKTPYCSNGKRRKDA